jgi:hypothetical protein
VRDCPQKHSSGKSEAHDVLPVTRRVWRRTRSYTEFAHKSRYINSRGVGRSLAISLPTAPAAEEVTK